MHVIRLRSVPKNYTTKQKATTCTHKTTAAILFTFPQKNDPIGEASRAGSEIVRSWPLLGQPGNCTPCCNCWESEREREVHGMGGVGVRVGPLTNRKLT